MRITSGALLPCVSIASGARSRSATETMKPADSATIVSSARTLQVERDTTAAAPITFALAATAVYSRAGSTIQNHCASSESPLGSLDGEALRGGGDSLGQRWGRRFFP